jgi:hypothetical protein
MGSSMADNRPRARYAWTGSLGLAVVGFAGSIGLMRLAFHVTAAKPDMNDGIVVRQRVVGIWMHPALSDLAQSPLESAAGWSRDQFRRYAEARGLEKAWYLIVVEGTQKNGERVVIPVIRRPYEMLDPYYVEFPSVLAVAAGKRPSEDFLDFAAAEVGAIPDHLAGADPAAVIDELRMLQRRASPQE